MRILNKLIFVVLLPFLFTACQSYKKVPYLQDTEVVNQIEQKENLYDAKIMPKDLLTIVVSCTSPELAAPFNLTVASPTNLSCIGRVKTRWFDKETGRTNGCRKVETLYERNAYRYSAYGKL